MTYQLFLTLQLDILRIDLTPPVSVASGERSFWKLKLIENYLGLRVQVSHRLYSLGTIVIEHKILYDLDFNPTVLEFVDRKTRKAKFI